MASKIKDGLFIGDAETSTDPEFLELNKISNLMNLSGREVPNVWAAHGLVYLTYYWEDDPDFRIFPDNFDDPPRRYLDQVGEIVQFIDGSLQHGISVLLFSTKGKCRCAVAACAYLMYKYKWGFQKAFDLVQAKKPDISFNKGIMDQMSALCRDFMIERKKLNFSDEDRIPFDYKLTPMEDLRYRKFDPAYLSAPPTDYNDTANIDTADEFLLINSYLNSKRASPDVISIQPKPSSHRRRVAFPSGRSIAMTQDPYSIPSVPSSGQVRVRGILKGASSSLSSASSSAANTEKERELRQRSYFDDQQSSAKSQRGANPTQGISDMRGDLYGFVGISMPHELSVGGTQIRRPSTADSAPSMTAEQRLQQMVHSMRGGQPPVASPSMNGSDEKQFADRPRMQEKEAKPSRHTSQEAINQQRRDSARDHSLVDSKEELERQQRKGEQRREELRREERRKAEEWREEDRREEQRLQEARRKANVEKLDKDAKESQHRLRAEAYQQIEAHSKRSHDRQSHEMSLAATPSAPSLYDLAYKDIIVPAVPLPRPSSRQNHSEYLGSDVSQSKESTMDDPLAAFSMLQLQGGAIRAKHSLEVTGTGRSRKSFGSSDKEKSSPSKIYREGSPIVVPRRRPTSAGPSSSTASTGSNRSNRSPREFQRRGSQSSVGTAESRDQRSFGTPRRAATPTKQQHSWR